MAWETEGTVGVTNASPTVTGVGTRFTTRARVGDGLLGPDGKIYEITNVNSETNLTINPPYSGTTASAQAYKIVPIRGYGKMLADLLRDGIDAFGGAMNLPDWVSPFNKSGAQDAIADTTPMPDAIPRTDTYGKLHKGYLPSDTVYLDNNNKIPVNRLNAAEAYTEDTLILSTADGTIHISRFDIEGLAGAIVGMFSILVQSILSRSSAADIRSDLGLGTAAEGDVVGSTGNSTVDVMSQKAVSEALSDVMQEFTLRGLGPYTNAVPTPTKVGHILAGKQFIGFTFNDLMDELFYPTGDATSTEPYNFIISVNDLGEFVVGGKDNAIATRSGTVISVAAADGITQKALFPFGTTVSISGGLGKTNPSVGGEFQVNPDGSFSFDVKTAFAALNEGSVKNAVLSYKILNLNTSEEKPATITIRVTGTNKAPIVQTAIPDMPLKSLDVVTYNLKSHFKDPNEGQTASLMLTSTALPSGLEINSAGVLSGTLPRLAHSTDPSTSITVRATDAMGEYVEDTFTLSVSRATVVPKNKAASTDADTSVTVSEGVNVLLHGVTSDGVLDTQGLKVSSVAGNPLSGGSVVVDVGVRGKITVFADGTYTFNPNSEFDTVPTGTTVTETIAYEVANDAGATGTANLVISVAGKVDVPALVAPAMTTFDFSVVSGDPTVIGDSVKYAITSTFSKGKIKLGEVEIARTGNVSSFTYTGGTLAGTTAYTDAGGLSATQLKELTVTAGASAVTYSAKADYSQGPQPLDSKGNAYDSPLPASSSAALTFTTPVASRWKWQATSGQSSVDMVQQVPADKATMPSDVDGKYLELTWAKQMVVGESRQLQIPAIWGGIKGIKVRDFAGNWVWLYGYATAYQDQYASSQVVVNIGGTNYTYDKLVADSSLKLAADLFRIYLN